MDCSKVTSFIKEFYNSQEFVPLSVPKFIGNEKNTSKSVLIPPLFPVLVNS